MSSPEDGEEVDDGRLCDDAGSHVVAIRNDFWIRAVWREPEELVSEPDSLGTAISSACVFGARDGRQTTLNRRREALKKLFRTNRFTVTLGGECEEAYSSLSRRLRTILVHYRRARAVGQQLAWMMTVHERFRW